MTSIETFLAVSRHLSSSDFRDKLVPILTKAVEDKIPNVKFCAARAMVGLREVVSAGDFDSYLVPLLQKLKDDKDLEV